MDDAVQSATAALREAQNAGGNRWLLTAGARKLAPKSSS